MEDLFDKYLVRLKERGYKHTRPRLTILEVLIENKHSHLSIEEILLLAQQKNPEIGIATAYRTMLLFEKLKMVYKLDFGDGLSRYEINEGDVNQHHHHLICLNCRKIIEVELDLLDELEDKFKKEESFSIIDQNLKFYGYCKNCQDEDREE